MVKNLHRRLLLAVWKDHSKEPWRTLCLLRCIAQASSDFVGVLRDGGLRWWVCRQQAGWLCPRLYPPPPPTLSKPMLIGGPWRVWLLRIDCCGVNDDSCISWAVYLNWLFIVCHFPHLVDVLVVAYKCSQYLLKGACRHIPAANTQDMLSHWVSVYWPTQYASNSALLDSADVIKGCLFSPTYYCFITILIS